MKKKIPLSKIKRFYKSFFIFWTACNLNCVEPFEISSQTYEEVIIVEAVLTNEQKFQTVSLSTTNTLGTVDPIPLVGAEVVVQNNDVRYTFSEIYPGQYQSDIEFGAIVDNTYQLRIRTANGNHFSSSHETLPSETQIGDIVPRKIIDHEGVEGIEILVNSFDPMAESIYYRYTYEETYKIIAPRWNQLEAFVVSKNPPVVDVRLRPQEELICYGSNKSPTSLLFSTEQLTEDRVTNLPVRFIEKGNFIIAHRYSILVTQFVQTEKAFDFYEKLNELSNQGNLFSQSQPSFLTGNIFVEDGTFSQVTGYFDVVSVSRKRIFFNFEDFFENTSNPAYIVGCDVFESPSLTIDQFGTSQLIQAIENETLEFFTDNSTDSIQMPQPTPEIERPFIMVPRICGDCTVIGNNVIPDFWIE